MRTADKTVTSYSDDSYGRIVNFEARPYELSIGAVVPSLGESVHVDVVAATRSGNVISRRRYHAVFTPTLSRDFTVYSGTMSGEDK